MERSTLHHPKVETQILDYYGVEVPMLYKNLFMDEQLQILIDNSKPSKAYKNNVPVAYLTVDKLGWKFLVTQIDKNAPNIAFGLADYDTKLKLESFDLIKISEVVEIEAAIITPKFHFYGEYPLAVYAMVAKEFGTIAIHNLETNFKEELSNATKPIYVNNNTDLRLLNSSLTNDS